MNYFNQKCRPTKRLLLPVAAALLAAGASFNIYAATAAGTQIKNLATVSYEDAAGNTYTAQSNEAVVTVAQVYSATINSTTTAVSASPGQPVDLSYTIENTGNGTDNFVVSAIDGIVGGDSLDADSITVYEDSNNNGQADAGEPVISALALAAGDIKSIVVRVEVPTSAIEGDDIGVTLTAEAEEGTGAPVAGSVIDLTPGKGPDTLDSTIESLITVTGDAVVVVTKNSIHDLVNNEIEYTITIKNNGNANALNALLMDGIPANTTLLAGSATTSGLITSNGDTMPAAALLNETVDGIDYNGDGDTADPAVDGISANDAILPANATVTITYTVFYDPAVVPGGTVISNIAYLIPDVDGDGTPDTPIATNEVYDTVGDTLLVSIDDTGTNSAAGVNDGGDDDAAANGVQVVDEVSAGEQVIFTNVLTNGGNVDDVLELSVANVSFPAGTVFTFWNDTGTVQLSDSNGAFGVDAGLVPSGGTKTITVIAQLPSGVAGPGPYDATVTVTSANDPTVTDTVTEQLGLISTSTADIHNASGGALDVDDNPIGTPDYSAVNTQAADVGTTVNIPLYIDNDGDDANSFALTAGSVYDNAANTVSNIPTGWTIEFFASDGVGNPVGSPISTTPSIPGQTTDYEVIAVVTIPADQSLVSGDYTFDNDADGTDEVLDGNGDGDGDYPLFFQIESALTGASDVTMEAIDVNSVVSATLTPNGSAQLDAGGSEEYLNTLTNTGNSTETFAVSATNTQGTWSNTIAIDTDGDGVADTELANLTTGVIQVLQPDGTVVDIEVTVTGAGDPEFTLDAGESLPITATVFAPATAPEGQVDVLTISAININTGDLVSAQDQSQVIAGKVRIEKFAAIDTDCDGTADTPFAINQPSTVEPGQCVIWQIVAENQGSSDALNVQVFDEVPAFTTFEAGSLSYCINLSCTPVAVSDVTGDDEGEENAGAITFYIGVGANAAAGQGGELGAGNQATVQFSVSID